MLSERHIRKWIILTSASVGGNVFLFPFSGEQNWGTKISSDIYLFPLTEVAWRCSLLVKFGLQCLGFTHLCLLSHLTLPRTWPQITHGGSGTDWRNVPSLSHHHLSRNGHTIKEFWHRRETEEAICYLNPSHKKTASDSRPVGLVLKRLFTLQSQKVR